jgi:hypothetical protein
LILTSTAKVTKAPAVETGIPVGAKFAAVQVAPVRVLPTVIETGVPIQIEPTGFDPVFVESTHVAPVKLAIETTPE